MRGVRDDLLRECNELSTTGSATSRRRTIAMRCMAEKTVKTDMSHVLAKLEVADRAQAAL